MKTATRFVLCCMPFILASSAIGDDHDKTVDERQKTKQYFDFYVGEWAITKKGTDETGSLVVTNTESGRVHSVVFSLGEDGGSLNGIWGYDQESKHWVGRAFGPDGYIEMWTEKPKGRTVAQPGDTIRFTQTKGLADKSAAPQLSSHKIHSMDHFSETVDGVDGVYTYRRKTPRLSSEDAKLRDFIKTGSHVYSGSTDEHWEGTEYGPVGNFAGQSKVHSVGIFLVEEWKEEYPDGAEQSGLIVYNYDQASKSYRAEHFIGDGKKSNITITFPDDQMMMQQFEQTSASGAKSLVKGQWNYNKKKSSAKVQWELSLDDGKSWKPWLSYEIRHVE